MKINNYNIKYYADTKSSLSFCILVIGVLLAIFSTNNIENLWFRFLMILFNKYNILILLTTINININKLLIFVNKNYNYLSRTYSYKSVIKNNLKYIFSLIMYYLSIYIILSLAGAFIFCHGNIKVVNYFNTNIIIYIIYSLLKMIAAILTMNSFYYLLSFYIKKIFITFIAIIFNFSILFIPDQTVILHFYNIIPLYTFFLTLTPYLNFRLEVLCFFLYLSVTTSVNEILYSFIISKKGRRLR